MSIKRIFSALVCAMMLVGFTACEKEPDVERQEKIIGRWRLEMYEYSEYEDYKEIDHTYEYYASYDEDVKYIEFLKDGKYAGDLFGAGTYSISGDGERIYLTSADGETFRQYEFDGNGGYGLTLSRTSVTIYNETTYKKHYEYSFNK